MRIINVLELLDGIPSDLVSFVIYEEQLSEDVVEEAEQLFIEKINKDISPDLLTEDEESDYIEEGVYLNVITGYGVFLIWSETN